MDELSHRLATTKGSATPKVQRTVAHSEAALTLASSTPATPASACSTVVAQAAQCTADGQGVRFVG